jgi:hypothetical protein
MVIFALIRVGGLKRGPVVDNTWELFWQYTEGCVACIMASITPFRTLFVTLATRTIRKKAKAPSPQKASYSLRELLWRKHTKKSSNEANWIEMGSENPLPKPPAALLSGLRTFIRRNNRSAGLSTVMVTNTFDIEVSMPENPEREYQDYLRKTAGLPQIPVSKALSSLYSFDAELSL